MTKFFFLIIFFVTASSLQSRMSLPQLKERYLRPPEGIKYFTFGYSDLMASVLWLRVVQNFDHCEEGKYDGEVDYVAPEKNAKNKIKAVLQRQLKPSKCHRGWVYSMIDAITDIQPRFKLTYDVGAMFLSVAVDDREGARLIFEKGLKIYPYDWRLSYAAGYHYLWEIQDAKRAGELLLQSLNSGGPPYLASLAAGLYTEAGQAEFAYSVLMENLKKDPPKEVKGRILLRLKEIEPILKSIKKK